MSVTLSKDQEKWLTDLVGPSGKGAVATKSEVAAERLKAREAILAEALSAIDQVKGDLARLSQQVSLMDMKGKQLKLLTGELDPDDEVDTRGDVNQDVTLQGGENLSKITNLMSTVIGEQTRMREARTGPDGKLTEDPGGAPLFTEAEIADEIWTPLQRAGVLPENLVPSRYSAVMKTFAGAQQAYQKRLEAFSEKPKESGSDLGEKLGLGGDALAAGAKFLETLQSSMDISGFSKETLESLQAAGAVVSVLGATATVGKAMTGGDKAEIAKAFTAAFKAGGVLPEMASRILTKAIEATASAPKLKAAWSNGEWSTLVDSLGDGLAAVSEELGEFYENPALKQWGTRVKGALKTGRATSKLYDAGKAYASGTGEKSAVYDAIGDLAKEAGAAAADLFSGLVELQEGEESKKAKQEILDKLNPQLKEAQVQLDKVTGECLSTDKVKEDLDKIVKSQELATLLKSNEDLNAKLMEMAKAAAVGNDIRPIALEVGTLIVSVNANLEKLRELNEKLEKTKGEEQDLELKEKKDKLQGAKEEEGGGDEGGGGESEDVRAVMERLQKAREGMSPEEQILAGIDTKMQAQDNDAEAQDFAAMLNNDFTATMNELNDPVQKGRLLLSKIDPLIAKLKDDKKYYTMWDAIIKGGIPAGTALFKWAGGVGDYAGPLGSFKECVSGITAAFGHADELKKWRDSLEDSRNAGASTLVAAEMNRAGLEEKFQTQVWRTSAIKAIQGVAGALRITGVALPVSAAVEGGARLTGALDQLVTKYYKTAELKKAWQDYEEAARDPENRKNIRKALRSNPTLSKYALAWAAVIDGDPLARSALGKCGLNEATLADKDTNAEKVVEYLENVYDQDPIVLQANPKGADWWPGKPELTSRNWMRFLKAAEDSSEKLEGTSGMLVTQMLVRMEKLFPLAEKTPTDEKAVDAARDAIDELIEVLTDYNPLNDEDKPVKSMRLYADAMLARATLKRRALPAKVVTT